MKNILILVILIFAVFSCDVHIGTGISTRIIDHNNISLDALSKAEVETAKAKLSIAYWHTSHGSQLTTGMANLDAFMGDTGLYTFNATGTDNALKLQEPRSTDAGKNEGETWEPWTREFLQNPDNSDVNVIMWAWCGQLSTATESYVDLYLQRMNQLEEDYPHVLFVYMTGHSDGTGLEGNLHARNMQIRDFCEKNSKYLYDFYDIECYDPDGNYYGDKYVDDACNYDGGNWAREWQQANSDMWYSCSSAHSEPLNANLKAYAAWHLWVALAKAL